LLYFTAFSIIKLVLLGNGDVGRSNSLLLKNSQRQTNTIANTKATHCSRRWRIRRIFWLIWSSSYCWI